MHRGRHVRHPGAPEDGDREGLPGGCEQGDQGLRQVQRHTPLHDLQLEAERSLMDRGVKGLAYER